MIAFSIPQIELTALPRALYNAFRRSDSIARLERAFAQYVGTSYAVALPSGRFALFLLFQYFRCQGKKVVAPAYTCIPAADSYRWAGANPYFVDIDPTNYNPQFDASLLNADDVGAICLSYLYGIVGDIEPFLKLAKEKHLPVIEDAANALGAKINGKRVGSLGNAGVFSLQSSKIVSSWRGAVVTTNDSDLYAHLKSKQKTLKQTSAFKMTVNLVIALLRRLFWHPVLYYGTFYLARKATLNPRIANLLTSLFNQNPSEASTGDSPEELPESDQALISPLQAELALATMAKIDLVVETRRKNSEFLLKNLSGLEGVELPTLEPAKQHAFGRLPIRLTRSKKADAETAFARMGVEVGTYYPYIIPDTKYFKYSPLRDRDFTNARAASLHTILLPSHCYLRQCDLQRIVEAVRAQAGS